VVEKVIAKRINSIFSVTISREQFGFLEAKKIHEAIRVAREAIHGIKTRKSKGTILKIDLSNSYDRVSWLYIKLLLTHLGFEVPFINSVMSCISEVYFVVLINGVASHFFHVERGLRQGFLLSPLLFLLVAKGLNRALEVAKIRGEFHSISISPTLHLIHLLFMDDVLIFYGRIRGDIEKFHSILNLFGWATWVQINERESTLPVHKLEEVELTSYRSLFPYKLRDFDAGLK